MRFAVVGIIGAVVDFGTFNLLVNLLHVAWQSVASVISFTAAVVSNFLWNRFWTYPDSRSKSIPKQVVQFIVGQHHRPGNPHPAVCLAGKGPCRTAFSRTCCPRTF